MGFSVYMVYMLQHYVSHSHVYPSHALVFFFLAGTIAPLVHWTLHKTFRLDVLKYLNFPIIFTGAANLPPAKPLNYVPLVLTCYVFNYFIRRRHFSWWSKYVCEYLLLRFIKTRIPLTIFFKHVFGLDVLSASLDAGYAIGTTIIFFALQYPKNGTIGQNSVLTWWGNTVQTKTADYAGLPYKTIAEGETFGPSSW